MGKSERYIKESVGFAALLSGFVFCVNFIQQLLGFDKRDPSATPKTIAEVLAEWPRLLGIAVFFFIGTLWWRLSQKEKVTFICNSCQELVEREAESDMTSEVACAKCGGAMEPIEGYYDRHPDRR